MQYPESLCSRDRQGSDAVRAALNRSSLAGNQNELLLKKFLHLLMIIMRNICSGFSKIFFI